MTDNLHLLPLLVDLDAESILLLLTNDEEEPLPRTQSFCINELSDEFCRIQFRFCKDAVLQLRQFLRIPITIKLVDGMKIPGIEALCVLLRRLAYPNRLVDLMKYFPRTRGELSRIINHMLNFMMENHGHLLENIRHPFLDKDMLQKMSDAVHMKGAPYKMCFGFLDGTVRPICRPSINQRVDYNGHKRTHALKFQSLMLPNGIIATMHGPVSGRRHDAYILQESKLLEQLEDNFFVNEGSSYFLYGDPAYPLRKNLIVPFKGHTLTPVKRLCNKRMSSVREAVEWGFGKIVQNFAFLDYKKNLKTGMQPIGNYYLVGTIFTNCHTCVYGSQTSDYFNCNPPSLQSYLRFI